MLNHVPEALPAFSHTWRIVCKEAALLKRTRDRLFQHSIDAEWVTALDHNDVLSEQVAAFASRYSRLQDTLGEKLFPRLLELVEQQARTLIDTLNQIERLGLVSDAREWLTWRNLRNSLIHEYVEDPSEFANALNTASRFSANLLEIVAAVDRWLEHLGVSSEHHQS